jgi:tape measure domain-containing protein
MATELATGYINLVPSARGMKQAIEKQLGDAGVSGGAIASKGFSGTFKSGIGSLAGFAAKTLKTGLVAGGAAGGALLAVALKGGYDRLVTIQNATRALTIQLGSSAAAAELLKNVLQVVKGTPFPLDQFASAAQQLSSMGIAASKIPAYLTAIGDVAATKGSQAGEYVDRLTLVFGQIHAQGKIMGQDILQLAQAGVPALTILANHFGKNTAEMQKMISKGAVPADQAIQILTDGIEHGSKGAAGPVNALAGTMKTLGSTTSGSLANARAALSRFGIALIQPAFDAAPKVLANITDRIDSLTARIGPAVEKLTQSSGFKNFFSSISSGVTGAASAISRVDFGAIVGRIATVITGTVIPAVASFGREIAPLIPRVVAIAQSIGQTLVTAVQRVTPVVVALIPWVERVAKTAAEFAVNVGSKLATALRVVVPILTSVATTAGRLLAKIPPAAIIAIGVAFASFAAAKGAASAINGITGRVDQLKSSVSATKKIFTDASTNLSRFGNAAKSAGSKVADLASSAISKVASTAKAAKSGIVDLGKSLASSARLAAAWAKQGLVSAANWVKSTAAMVANKVATLAQAVAAKVAAAAQWLLNAAMDANPITLIIIAIIALIGVFVLAYQKIGWFRDFVQAAFRLIKNVISAVVDWVKTNWPLLLAILTGPIGLAVLFITKNWDTIKAGFTAVKDWIGARVSDVVGFITGIPGRIAGVASSAFNALKDGISSAKNWVFDRVTDIVNAVLGIPGKIGSLATALLQAGKDLMTGLVNGIEAAPNAIIDALKEVAKHVPGPIKEILKHVPVVSDLFKAEGGPVLAGQPYIVGEKGPELFVPKVPGRIVPNGQLPSAASIQPAAQPAAARGGLVIENAHFGSTGVIRDLDWWQQTRLAGV